eukprot:GFUD01007730.1.p1 GENE.GFUD01007730.1~~GFUD01007730.1.p1  ORF type:complete len:382 (+),score=76.81 GFUD01007730.1:41-1186(+)
MALRENIVLRSSEKRESAEILGENSVRYLSQTVNIKRTSNKSIASSNEETGEDIRTVFRILVERGRKYFLDLKRFYPMCSKVRGHALIINNEKFSQRDIYPNRKGSSVDIENLDNLFSQLGFLVDKCENMKRNETFKKLIDFSEMKDHIDADMAVICISSHGSENGKVISADCLEIDLETDILRRFNNQYCPNLKGKPKFFMVQACRGDELDFGLLTPSPTSGIMTDAKKMNSPTQRKYRRERTFSEIPKELTWEDMVIAYSTLPGYVANRDHFRGTWFIESICKIFMEKACDTPLRDMLDEVALDLKINYISEVGTKQSFNYDVRHFYKKLYFNPGLYLDSKEQWKASTLIDEDHHGRRRAMSESQGNKKVDAEFLNCLE